MTTPDDAANLLRAAGVGRGELVGLVVAAGHVALAASGTTITVVTDDPARTVARLEADLRPRWVWWDIRTPARFAGAEVHVAACWDVAAVHRLLAGGWRADPARAWALVHDLDPDTLPHDGPADLFGQATDGTPDDPVRPDGYLRPDWVAGDWALDPQHSSRWAALALDVARRQLGRLQALAAHPAAASTARAESAAELLCAELTAGGLPMDRDAAEAIVESFVGPRPRSPDEAEAARTQRDDEVLRHAPPGITADLRNPAQVRALLRSVGVEVPDTRAWRLEAMRDVHPLVAALLRWRKAERIATTFGYSWLDEHLGADGRLRGTWSGADGAAGRMTASSGLHNMPAELRPAVVADEGHVFVRADLGQIEPRVLAAVSGDPALVRATRDDDLYLPVARDLGVDRATAKVAVLGAMYGQTTGHGARALARLESAYPRAMALLHDADVAGQVGRDLRTHGGRLIRMWTDVAADRTDRELRSRAAARGRYARNAVVQGAAAELFKAWAATVRARAYASGARIVLCLHDELLVHVPADEGRRVADLVVDCLHEATHRWSPTPDVRFVADVDVVRRWSDATDPTDAAR